MLNNNVNKYIDSNYNSIRKILYNIWRTMDNDDFNEDIFHDTLIKCMDKFNNKQFIEEEFKAYIIASFKMNVIRSKQYFNVAMKSNEDIENINTILSDKFNVDFNIIIEDVKRKFGQNNCGKFMDWLENKSIKEINEIYNCNNTRYLIDKIKSYIKKTYKDI